MKKVLLFSFFAAICLNFSTTHAAAEPDRLHPAHELLNSEVRVKGADEDVLPELNTHFTSLDKTRLFIQLEGKKYRCFISEGNMWKKCPGIWRIEQQADYNLIMAPLS